MTNSNNMKKNVVWLVRDARDLTVYEKAFLFVVASRGLAKTYRKTLMQDMGGISTGMLSKVVSSLREKDLIEVHEGFWQDGKKSQTAYTIKDEVLATFVPARGERSQDELVSSPHELGSSQDERGSSPHGGYKGTVKVTKKETSKETTTTNASAPVVPSKVKDTQVDDSPKSSLPNKVEGSPSLSLVQARSVSLLREKAAVLAKKDDAAATHLETLIAKEHRMNPVWAENARMLFEDETWRADKTGAARAAAAFFAANDKEVYA